jgi:hypothetical protein
MSARNPLRHFARREPKPVGQLSRTQIAARIHVLRQVLDLLWSQSETDGGMPYRTIGTGKVELIQLEQQLRDLDAAQRDAAVSQVARDLLVAPWEVQIAAAGRKEG